MIGWIEEALEPLRSELSELELHRLVLVITARSGSEALVWLTDVAGLSLDDARELMRWSAQAMLRAGSTDRVVSRSRRSRSTRIRSTGNAKVGEQPGRRVAEVGRAADVRLFAGSTQQKCFQVPQYLSVRHSLASSTTDGQVAVELLQFRLEARKAKASAVDPAKPATNPVL